MAQQFLLEGRSLDELAREATALYGSGARIVRAEKVLDPGVAGFLGRRHLEVTVEVPDAYVPVSPPRAGVHVLGDRAGILALLESADRAEDDANGRDAAHPPPRPSEPVSTQSPAVTDLLARLGEERTGRGVPVPLCSPGDLVVVLGLGDSARVVASSMVRALAGTPGGGFALHLAGADDPDAPSDCPRLDSRWDVAEARALAVEASATVLTAYALGSPTAGLPHLADVSGLGADQVWLVVDARHKPDETHEWVSMVRKAVRVDALAVVGAGDSRTAHTVNRLGLPLGWLDGQPAPRTVL
ncbi:hypothetical protein [Terracoccus sp. 273MFTsu3.1]|uniref:hypothetical protein n=1 Tax=Terracoccus sp. 273MFTsu3.1 TaxID=1172188 RepID=UPI0003717C96|nr:hypothetical protein [Terracoccus sp. 273MFTsu3.1]